MIMLERSVASTAAFIGERPHVRGKFLLVGDQKLYIRGVTYGPFRPDEDGSEYHTPDVVERDFAQMAAHGINAVRTYTVPPRWLLDLAQQYGLCVLVGLPWQQHIAFLDDKRQTRSIEERIRTGVRACAGHPAVLGYTIGNEIPATIVRWHGHHRIERFLQRLYRAAKAEDPDGLVTYVNFPSTEYLRLPFLDLFCFNVYLEDQERLEAYLARLQNLAGDRPLLLAEIGLDSGRHGEEAQAEALDWQVRTAFASGCAGSFVFAWTDEWYRGGYDIDDWHFGLTDRSRRPKTALAVVRDAYAEVPFPPDLSWPRISVVVCSYNGACTLRDCCEGLLQLDYPDFEVIIVDDGSTDATAAIAGEYPFHVISIENRGLSTARNVGLAAASGEIVAYLDDDAYPDPHWLIYLAATFLRTDFAAVGGPNIAPPGDGPIAACIDNAPGNPTHVLISDQEADHLPGCNLAVRAAALRAIGGFDPQFRIAGDDVDVCWRLQQQGWRLGFSPAAMVWHHRRHSVRMYWKQQKNYGKAEALLERKWPAKYNAVGHLNWSGRVYGKGLTQALGCAGRIYHGTWGSAPFQSLEQPTPGMLQSLPLMPEWYLIIIVLAALSALGALWTPLLIALPLLVLAAGVLLVQAGLSAAQASFAQGAPDAPRAPSTRLKLWSLTALLHLLQPLARLWGHLRGGLTPWRRRVPGVALPRTRTSTIWSEEWKAPEAWLHTIETKLRAAGAYVLHGGDYDRWDLEVRGGLLGSARTRMAVEEHGAGRQQLRLRSWPKYSPKGMIVAFLFAVLAIAAARDQAWTAFTILVLTAVLLILRALLECATATAAILSVLRDAGRGGIWLPKIRPSARRDEGVNNAGEDVGAVAVEAGPARAKQGSRPNRKHRGAKQRERGTLVKYFPSVLHYVRPYWKLAAASIVVIFLHTLAGLLAPWPLKILIDSVLGGQPLPPILTRSFGALAEDRFTLLVFAVVAGVAIVSVENGLRVLNSYTNTRLEQKMVLDFRGDLFQHTQRLSMAYHDKRRSGRLIYAISSQGGAAASLAMTLPPLAQSALTLVGMFWITLQVDRQLALLSLVVVPFLYYSVHYYVTHIQTRLRQVRRMEAESLSIIYEAISMLRVIVAFGREDNEHRRFREQGEQAVDARVRLTVRQTLFSLAINLITAIGTALVLGFGAYRVLEGQLTLGQLLVVISYIAAVYKPLESISYTISAIQERIGGLQTAYEVLHTEPDIKDAPGAVDIARTTGHVTFEGVHFGYTNRVDTLKDISFDAQAGHVIAIVGPTGAGKSTLVSLIPRFYEPNQGRILLDGRDIRELTLKSLRQQISIVMQEPLLFSGTIADNIGYGRPDATMDEIIEAAKAANAHDFIMRRPEGYESRLGERGVQLSGGERQRISIARAFLKDAPILILDEPTSSLDAKTEAAILRALGRLMVGRTTFVISHRLSAIVHADMILVLDQGELVEQGTHEELLERDGLYAELYTLQTRWMRKKLRPAVESDSEIGDETPGRTRKMRKKLPPDVESDSEIGDETPGHRRKRRKKLPPVVAPDTVTAAENQA